MDTTTEESSITWSDNFGEVKYNPDKYTARQLNNRLSFAGLETKLQQVLGVVVNLKGEMFEERKRLKVKLMSQNLFDKVGMLSTIMEDVRIHDWGSSVLEHENGDIVLSVSLHFCWDFKDGGSNGHDLLFQAFYNFDRREWAFDIR